jgi:hypothetical protein
MGIIMLNKNELMNEANYLASVKIAKVLLNAGFVTEGEYSIICTKLRAEYRPIIYSLLSGE